jgi:hypothetical protein
VANKPSKERKQKKFSLFLFALSQNLCIFVPEKETTMCTVTVNINEKVLHDLRPDLDNSVAIRQWVQDLIDLRIQQMELEDTETMSIEEAREMTLAAVREEYARSA